jgi:hypothetical protein
MLTSNSKRKDITNLQVGASVAPEINFSDARRITPCNLVNYS